MKEFCYSLRKTGGYSREYPKSEGKEMMANEADETPEEIVEHLAELGLNPQDDDLSDMLDDAPTTPPNMYGEEQEQMGDKTELQRLRRSWVFTKIGASLIPVSIIYSWYLLIDGQTQERQGNLDGFVWLFICFLLIGFCVVISLIGFIIDLFRNRQKVVSVEKSKTNLIVWFRIWPIFFFVTFLVVRLFSGIFGVRTGIQFIFPYDFGLGVLAAWFVGNLYRQTTKNIE